MNLLTLCLKLNISEEELFVRAYNECGGLMYGLQAPRQLYQVWKQGNCATPLYVYRFARKHKDAEPQFI